MKFKKIVLALVCLSSQLYAQEAQQIQRKIEHLQKQTQRLQSQLMALEKRLSIFKAKPVTKKEQPIAKKQTVNSVVKQPAKYENNMVKYHASTLTVHAPDEHPESIGFYPTALVAENRVVTYIAGTPVVTSPYLGARPAFDGSDYIVNISSINRDIRLMQQRRQLYDAYKSIGYPIPKRPIIALSGKTEPAGMINSTYIGNTGADLTLASNELDVAAALNQNVEGYLSISYDESPPTVGPRVANSKFRLNLGFVNIGNLDRSPIYFTAGQLYVPFGRYASSMISPPLTLNLARIKTRPFILGYKSQESTGPFVATYIYRSDTSLGKSGVGGTNVGYSFIYEGMTGEAGLSYISSIADSSGLQITAANPGTFEGFSSLLHGNEAVRKIQAMDVYGTVSYGRFNVAAEWVGAIESFRIQDLSFN
ncbi:LbtU family siderophore porin, partial [Legionella sp.]|uniref:LbtU family siderophore porin n=1 Tax=Legionella sp. TaxID=459 RepID=UPI003CA62245